MSIGFVVLALPLLAFALTVVVNRFALFRLSDRQLTDAPITVSILIPARNEAGRIGRAIASLRNQQYPTVEVIVLDDESTDGTAVAVRKAAGDDPAFRLVPGQPLPEGWLGKNWACHQLAQEALGDVLIFADADVTWQSDAIAAIVSSMQASQADLLSIWPTQLTITWAERLTVPLMALAVLGYLPLPLAHNSPLAAFSAANGQCMAFRREAYHRVGGHAAVRGDVLEDVQLARQIKRHGFRLRLADGCGFVACRMYESWQEVRKGFGKNLLAGFGGRVGYVVLATFFHWAVFILPWVWLCAWLVNPDLHNPFEPSVLICLGLFTRGGAAGLSGQRVSDALLMPLSVVLMTAVAAQGIWWHWRGGAVWKGRRIFAGSPGGAP